MTQGHRSKACPPVPETGLLPTLAALLDTAVLPHPDAAAKAAELKAAAGQLAAMAELLRGANQRDKMSV